MTKGAEAFLFQILESLRDLAPIIPGRNTVIDGFGLIAFVSLFPIMSVLAYAQISTWRRQRSLQRDKIER